MAFNQPEEFILLSTQTASSSASLSFTSLITSKYPVYYFKLRNIVNQNNSSSLNLTFSTDNGSTYLSTNYQWSQPYITQNSSGSNHNNSDSSIPIINGDASNVSTRGAFINIFCYGFGQAVNPGILSRFTEYDSFGNIITYYVYGSNTGTTAINAVKFTPSAGNITSGSISLYGQVI